MVNRYILAGERRRSLALVRLGTLARVSSLVRRSCAWFTREKYHPVHLRRRLKHSTGTGKPRRGIPGGGSWTGREFADRLCVLFTSISRAGKQLASPGNIFLP